MKYRTKIWPKSLRDLIGTVFFFLVLPTVYFFELFFVLPKIYPTWSFWFNVHLSLGTFLLFNVLSCFWNVILIDTSTFNETNLTDAPTCEICKRPAPPRSFHCSHCNVCILKRDHHCIFTSCCIGHKNMRFFMMMLLYIAIGATYGIYMNVVHFYSVFEKGITSAAFTLLCLYLEGTSLLFGGLLFTLALLYHYYLVMVKGSTTYELAQDITTYDVDRTKNIENVFGVRWKVAWIYPFINSQLPGDGFIFETKKKTN